MYIIHFNTGTLKITLLSKSAPVKKQLWHFTAGRVR